MKPNAAQTVHHLGSHAGELRMGIDVASLAHIQRVLTDLYSNPIGAVVREYSTNALDSHIDAGISEPIHVSLPSGTNPTFVVQDFGLGLSVDDITEIYSQYGASTKRDSDAVNGLLGLGCKSGLTYALSFNVTAVKNGVKTFALVTTDDEGVGTIKIIDTLGTEERNGVTILIPVKPNDVYRFQNEANALYRFWQPGTVLVNGEEPESLRDDEKLLWLDDDVAVKIDNSEKDYVVMGNVAYPTQAKLLYGLTIIANVPMGSVNFTPAREALHYTKLTEETIELLKEFVVDRLNSALIDSCKGKHPVEILRILSQWRTNQHVRATVNNLISYLGFGPKLETAVNQAQAWTLNESYGRRRGKILSATKLTHLSWYDILDRANTVLIYDYPFKGVSENVRSRLIELAAKQGHGSYFWILPAGVNVNILRGQREGLYSWQEVLDKTPDYAEEKPARTKQTKTIYQWRGPHGFESGEFIKAGGKPILYHWQQYGAAERYQSEAFIVEIQDRQVARFLRSHPEAKPLSEYHREQFNAATAALTDEDKLKATILHGFAFRGLFDHLAKIKDKDLRKLLKLDKAPASKRLARYLVVAGGLNNAPRHTLPEEVFERYPLLQHRGIDNWLIKSHVDDILLYLNAKYPTIKNV